MHIDEKLSTFLSDLSTFFYFLLLRQWRVYMTSLHIERPGLFDYAACFVDNVENLSTAIVDKCLSA